MSEIQCFAGSGRIGPISSEWVRAQYFTDPGRIGHKSSGGVKAQCFTGPKQIAPNSSDEVKVQCVGKEYGVTGFKFVKHNLGGNSS